MVRLEPVLPSLELGDFKPVLGVKEALEQRALQAGLAPHSEDRVCR